MTILFLSTPLIQILTDAKEFMHFWEILLQERVEYGFESGREAGLCSWSNPHTKKMISQLSFFYCYQQHSKITLVPMSRHCIHGFAWNAILPSFNKNYTNKWDWLLCELTCSAATVLLGLHLYSVPINLGMKALQSKYSSLMLIRFLYLAHFLIYTSVFLSKILIYCKHNNVSQH